MKIQLSSLALAAALAACGAPEPAQQAETPAPDKAAAPAAPETRTAQGQGRVTAVDAAAGTVTLAHEPIPALEWPAMTMAFKASSAALAGIEVGDDVSFDLLVTSAGPEVTRIGPRAAAP